MNSPLVRVSNRLLTIHKKLDGLKQEAKKELIHERVEELYRGKGITNKLIGILKIISA